jgi:hypothetical protein
MLFDSAWVGRKHVSCGEIRGFPNRLRPPAGAGGSSALFSMVARGASPLRMASAEVQPSGVRDRRVATSLKRQQREDIITKFPEIVEPLLQSEAL